MADGPRGSRASWIHEVTYVDHFYDSLCIEKSLLVPFFRTTIHTRQHKASFDYLYLLGYKIISASRIFYLEGVTLGTRASEASEH